VSLGATRGGIGTIFLLCGSIVTGLGVLLGLAGGLLLTRYINPVHRAFSSLTGLHLFDPTVYRLDYIPTDIEAGRIGRFVVCTLLCALVCTWWPARQASRLEVVEALSRD
jgi:lipoprotein-releasing system permease protein